jgi:septum formation protein
MVADVDEERVTDPDPALNVVRTAALKARAVVERVTGDAVVIGADTTVALDGQMLNKPAGPAEARQMLRALRGRVHQVHTGVVLIHAGTGRTVTDVATVDVPMRAYSNQEIETYIATGDPLDKAGGYAIQHPEFAPAPRLAGCFAGVMGLSLCHLARSLRAMGVEVGVDIAAACQAAIAYDCPVFEDVLSEEPAGIGLEG